MNIIVANEREKTVTKIVFSGVTVADLLQQLHLNLEAFLVVRNNVVITEDEALHEEDTLELLSVISGG